MDSRSVVGLQHVALMLLFTSVCNCWDMNNRTGTAVVNDRPIIGIVAQDSHSHPGKCWISATYVKYLEQAGARVVPVRCNQSPDYYKSIVDMTNGVLIPGGSANLINSQFARSARLLWARAMELNKAGDYYPIWGTCLGFETLCNLTAGVNLLQPTDSENITWPLDFAPGYKSSRLFGSAPPRILQSLQTEDVTQNEHQYSILTKVFESTVLSKFFKKLSTNKDRNGVEFISTIEGYKFPIYGTQWHPEKNNMNWNPHYVINHSAHAVLISEYMANFFVNEARTNKHRFPDVLSEAKHIIQNYPLYYTPDGTFNQEYFFD